MDADDSVSVPPLEPVQGTRRSTSSLQPLHTKYEGITMINGQPCHIMQDKCKCNFDLIL